MVHNLKDFSTAIVSTENPILAEQDFGVWRVKIKVKLLTAQHLANVVGVGADALEDVISELSGINDLPSLKSPSP